MSTSAAVLADAQFSVAQVFKPFPNFERHYQGADVSIPIAIPGTLDPDAGKPGIDANLLAGIPVPFGSKMCLWIPTICDPAGGFQLQIREYRYRVLWRLRNLRDYKSNQGKLAFHFPKESLGQADQFVIPCAAHVNLLEGLPQDELNPGGFAQFSTRREMRSEAVIENIVVKSAIPNPAISPTGEAAAYQQGLATGNFAIGSNATVMFNPVQIDVMGDEFMLLVDRPATIGGVTWDFSNSGYDLGFSAFYGTQNNLRSAIKDLGVYVFTGSNP